MRRTLALNVTAAILASALSALALPASHARAGACARPQDMIEVLSGPTEVLSPEVGVLVSVTTTFGPSLGAPRIGPDAQVFDVGAVLEQNGTTVPLRVEVIAPSLAHLVPTAPVSAGDWNVVVGERSVPVRFGAPVLPPTLAAPRLREVHTRTRTSSGPRGSSSYTTTTAELAHGMPAGAIGIVLYAVLEGVEPAVLFTLLEEHGSSITLFSQGGRCGWTAPGVGPPATGATVRAAWIDRLGRVGARSRTVHVGG